ncbi:hypothetical protein F0919_12960 [Taibaiella lutea]|uniref:Uncharacterized protein n=1 Tax=Taibaiella lutea TaxID=2608001 RepID=A0A5M6CE52_9BACT|nr:hypothetical protein [Taibaiella lutea]KAA5533444.1 hypothetical protein F0919_12960 [Taibaiella lutea]
MKRIIFILILGLTPWIGFSQDTTHQPDTNSGDTVQQDIVNDHGEAGGIDANEIANNNKDAISGLWTGLIGGTIGAVLMLGITSYFNSRKKKTQEEQRIPDSKLFIDESVEVKSGNKEISAADVKKLKAEIKDLKLKLEEAKNETTAYKKNLDVYTDFDQKYYNEAFRKLISPMNDAMEKGSRKEIIETLLKIMSHFSSLTRYKIAKKQAYDEPNMQYLMNQRMKNDAAVEIDSNTPVDKIPKNIKVLVDLLSEQSSTGLDESIISGYKIKNL